MRTGAENLVNTGIRFPDRPDSNRSLYQLSYAGPHGGVPDLSSDPPRPMDNAFATKVFYSVGHPASVL